MHAANSQPARIRTKRTRETAKALGSEDLVGRQTMACKIKYTILALAVTLLLSGLLLAQRYGDDDDDDGGYYRGRSQAQAQQYGYENGYRDGLRRGREE